MSQSRRNENEANRQWHEESSEEDLREEDVEATANDDHLASDADVDANEDTSEDEPSESQEQGDDEAEELDDEDEELEEDEYEDDEYEDAAETEVTIQTPSEPTSEAADGHHEDSNHEDSHPEDSDHEDSNHGDGESEDDETDSSDRPAASSSPAVSLVELVSDFDSTERPLYSGAPSGIFRGDRHGRRLIDALAGRASPFGFGLPKLQAALSEALQHYLGDASSFEPLGSDHDSSLPLLLQQALGTSLRDLTESIFLEESPSAAVERALRLARNWHSDAYRIIAIVDSDHGRTGMARTASGLPALHDSHAPMMAGFRHIADDVEQLREAVDETTAAILLSPVSWQQAGRPLDAAFLQAVQNLCDQQNLLFVLDETQVGFASTSQPLVMSAISDVRPDIVVLASGLFGGLSGGLTLASRRVTGEGQVDVARYPLAHSAITSILQEIVEGDIRDSVNTHSEAFAVALAQAVSEFDFVRDVNVLGMSIALETDLPSADLVQIAGRHGLRIETAGETAIRLQPPGMLQDSEQQALLDTLAESFTAVQQAAMGLEA